MKRARDTSSELGVEGDVPKVAELEVAEHGARGASSELGVEGRRAKGC